MLTAECCVLARIKKLPGITNINYMGLDEIALLTDLESGRQTPLYAGESRVA